MPARMASGCDSPQLFTHRFVTAINCIPTQALFQSTPPEPVIPLTTPLSNLYTVHIGHTHRSNLWRHGHNISLEPFSDYGQLSTIIDLIGL